MKLTLLFAVALSISAVSCNSNDQEYADFKAQQEAQRATQGAPYGPNADPYGVPSPSEAGTYQQNPPLQPLPGVDPIDPGPRSAGTNFPTIPSGPSGNPYPGGNPSGVPVLNTVPHPVVAGDTLWGLSQRYGTSVDAIKAANGLTSDTIQTGTTLQIPRN